MATRLNRYINSVSAFDTIEIALITYSSNPIRDANQDVTELMESIKTHGLLEPIIVRPRGKKFEVLAGTRRLRACRLLKQRKMKCIVTDLDDAGSYEVSLVENVQRKTLSPLEEALAFKNYCQKFGWGSQSDLARKIGKSQEFVSHRMKLLDLASPAREALKNGEISTTAAEELVWIKDRVSQATALEMLKAKQSNTKSVRLLPRGEPESLPAASAPDFESERGEQVNADAKLLTEGILILRISLVRLDGIIAKVRDVNLRKTLLGKRYSLHKLVDELIQARGQAEARVELPAAIAR